MSTTAAVLDSEPVTVWAMLKSAGETPSRTWGVWRYDPADPWAVTLRLRGVASATFARDLLIRAVAGERVDSGQVQVFIDLSDLWLELPTPGGLLRWLAWVPLANSADWMHQTLWTVPPGAEAAQIDWAAEAAHLTGGEPA